MKRIPFYFLTRLQWILLGLAYIEFFTEIFASKWEKLIFPPALIHPQVSQKDLSEVSSEVPIKLSSENAVLSLQALTASDEKSSLKNLSLSSHKNKQENSFWANSSRVYHLSLNEDLSTLIRNFCAMQEVDVVISEKIKGIVNTRFQNLTPNDFWNQLTSVYNLSWFYDGVILYVYSREETSSRSFQLPPSRIEAMMDAIAELNFSSSNFTLRTIESSGILFLSGPPKFLEIAEDLMDKINAFRGIEKELDEITIRLFPLKYASAVDVAFAGNTIPGVATLLQSIIGEKSAVNAYTNLTNNVDLEKKAKKLSHNPPPEKTSPTEEKREEVAAPAAGAIITSDNRSNSIIIKDLQSRMPLYEDLIEALDQRVELIELNGAIIDVDVGAGINWGVEELSIHKNNTDYRFGTKLAPKSSNTNNNNEDSSPFPTTMPWTLGAKGIIDGTNFLSKINLLETKNSARTLGRPSVVTLDNMEAVIQDNTTYYTQLSGTETNDMFSTSAGTTFRITPHLFTENGIQKIRLYVSIESGSSKDNAGTQVKNTLVTTQAIIHESQSLLLGGYFYETEDTAEGGIPVLKDFPILGYIFKSKTKKKERKERLFLITPRIIHLDSEKANPYSKCTQNPGETRGAGNSLLQEIKFNPNILISSGGRTKHGKDQRNSKRVRSKPRT